MALTVRRSVYALVFLFWGHQVAAKWFPWAKLNFKCVDPPGSDHSFRLSGDWSNKLSVEDCQSKCHKHPYCEGFNYQLSTGTCFWKGDIDTQFSKEIEQKDADWNCYVAERVVEITTTVNLPPRATSPPASAATLNKDTWVKQTFVCMDPDGTDYSLKVDGKTYKQLPLDKCRTACTQLQGCIAFNWDADSEHCSFKYDVDIEYSKKTRQADFMDACYMLPGQVTVATTTSTTTPASTKAPWTTLFPYVRQPFVCVDPQGTNYDVAVDGNFFENSNINHCEAKCSADEDCMAFNYNTVTNLCHYKKNIDVQYSRSQEQTDPDSACYIVNRPSTSAFFTTNPGAPDTTPNNNPGTPNNNPDTPQPSGPASPSSGGNSPTPAPTPLRTVTTAPAPVAPVTAGPGMNETASDHDDCPKHVWQGVSKISKCAGKKTNMYSAEVFGIVISTVLLLAGAAVGVFFGVKKCRNRDDDIIDFSVRKRLLGLQLGNFKNQGNQDYNDFDYDAI